MFDARVLGNRVLLGRREMQLDQEELARMSGVSRSRISEIERGKGTNVGIDAIYGLADALEVTVPYLLGFTEDALGESPDNVAKEVSGDYLVVEVESKGDRRLIQEVVELISQLPAAKRAAAVAVLKAAIDLDRIEDETNLEPVGAREGGGVTISNDTDIEPREDLIAEKNRLLAFTDKMFPPDVALEVRRLVESGQGFTDADIERIISASNQRTLRQGSELFKNA